MGYGIVIYEKDEFSQSRSILGLVNILTKGTHNNIYKMLCFTFIIFDEFSFCRHP